MPRPKKDNYPLSLRIEKNVYDRLTQYCEDSGQTKTLAIERALMVYIDEYIGSRRSWNIYKNN